MANPKIDFDWLVEHRCNVQQLALRLYRLGEQPIVANHKDLLHTYTLFVGTMFSLWRSVFLALDKRTPEEMRTNAHMMLGIVIETNAIGFPQDQRTQQFTAGYYNSNSWYRLRDFFNVYLDAEKGYPVFKDAGTSEQRAAFAQSEQDRRTVYEPLSPGQLWERLYALQVTAMDIFEDACSKAVVPHPQMPR